MTSVETTDKPMATAHDVPSAEVRFFALGNLYKAPENVRKAKSSQMSDAELEASIESQGLISPLLVYEDDKQRGAVVAGGRRLAQLNALRDRGLLTADSLIPCVVRSQRDAVELSLAENIIRAPMHPADEFVAYQGLVKSGLDKADIAIRYGQSKAHVERVLRLAGVHRTLFNAFRRDELTLAQMMTYAAITDKKQQKAVFDLLGNGATEWRIRAAMTEGLEASDSAQAKFVTLEAYLAAGGAAREDMFTNKHYLCDLGLLSRLALEKLDADADACRSEGWGWVEVKSEHRWEPGSGRIYAQQQDVPEELTGQLESLRDQIEQLYDDESADEQESNLDELENTYHDIEQRIERDYSQYVDDEKALAGCIVCIDHDGQLCIQRGLVKPEDMKRLKALQRGEAPTNDGNTPAEDVPAAPKLSKALLEDLGLIRRGAIRAALAQNHQVAFMALHFQIVDAMVQRHRGQHYRLSREPSLLDVRSCLVTDTLSIETSQSERWAQERCARIEALDLAWADAEDISDRLQGFSCLSKESVRQLVAVAVSESLSLGTASPDDEPFIDTVAIDHLSVDFTTYYRPCPELYFSRLTKTRLLELGTTFWGDRFAEECKATKKAQIVARVAEFFTSDDSVLNDAQRALRDQWLPEQIARH